MTDKFALGRTLPTAAGGADASTVTGSLFNWTDPNNNFLVNSAGNLVPYTNTSNLMFLQPQAVTPLNMTATAYLNITPPNFNGSRIIARYQDSTDYIASDYGYYNAGTAFDGSTRYSLTFDIKIDVSGTVTSFATGTGSSAWIPGHVCTTNLTVLNNTANTAVTVIFQVNDLTANTVNFYSVGTSTGASLLTAGQWGIATSQITNANTLSISQASCYNEAVTATTATTSILPGSTGNAITIVSSGSGLGATAWATIAPNWVISNSGTNGSIVSSSVTAATTAVVNVNAGATSGTVTLTDATTGLSVLVPVYIPTTSATAYTLTGPTTAIQAMAPQGPYTVSLPTNYAPAATITITPSLTGTAGSTFNSATGSGSFTSFVLSQAQPSYSFYVNPYYNNSPVNSTVTRTLTVSSGGALTDPSGIAFPVGPSINLISGLLLTNSGNGTVSVSFTPTNQATYPVTYYLYRSSGPTAPGFMPPAQGTSVASVSSSATTGTLTLTDNTAVNGTVYYYRVYMVDSGTVGNTQWLGYSTNVVIACPHVTIGMLWIGHSVMAGVIGEQTKSDYPSANPVGQSLPAYQWTVAGVATGSEVIITSSNYAPNLHNPVESFAMQVNYLTGGKYQINAVDCGYSGAFVSTWQPNAHLITIAAQYPATTYPYVGISLGINDANSSPAITPSAYFTGMQNIIAFLIANGRTKIVLNYDIIDANAGTPHAYAGNLTTQALIAAYNAQLSNLVTYFAGTNPGIVVLGDTTNTDYTAQYSTIANYTNPFSASAQPGLLGDGTHPSITLSQQIGKNWAAAFVTNVLGITPALGRGRSLK
jgi:hypothetical protein